MNGLLSRFPSQSELQAILAALRHSKIDTGGLPRAPETPDEALLEPFSEPFESVAEVRSDLRAVEDYLRARSDRRAVFLTVYATMTEHVESGIESGQFEDPSWVRRYLVEFANRYRAAFVAFERGDFSAVPDAWQLGFRASMSDSTLFIQDALLGVNAHINYDLTYALRAISIDPDRPSKHRDHDRINDVLKRLVDVVQRALTEVYEAVGYDHLDAGLGDIDERLTMVGLTEARTLAWRNAVRLTDTRFEVVRRLVDWRVRAVSVGSAYLLLAPLTDPVMMEQLREIEQGEPVLEALIETFRSRSQELN